MRFLSLLFALTCCVQTLFGQYENVGIGTTTPHPSAKLEVSSTTQGVLIPRMTCDQRDAITSPADGLLVFVTDTCNNGDLPGLFYFRVSIQIWKPVVTVITQNGNTLDESYDEGGPGAGRMIDVDAGAVKLTGAPGNTTLEVSNTTAKSMDITTTTGNGMDIHTTTGAGADITVDGGDGVHVTNTVAEGVEISTIGTGRGIFAENLTANSGNVIEANMGGTSAGHYYDANGRAGFFTLLDSGSPRPALEGYTLGTTFGVLGITDVFSAFSLEPLPSAGIAGLCTSISGRNGVSGLSRLGDGVWGRSTKSLSWAISPLSMNAGIHGLASTGFGNSDGSDLFVSMLGYTTSGIALLAHNDGTGHGVVGIAKGVSTPTQAGVWGMTQDGAWEGPAGQAADFPYLDDDVATRKGTVAVLGQSKSDVAMWAESQGKFGLVATLGPKLGLSTVAPGFDKVALMGVTSHDMGAAAYFSNTVPSSATTVGINSKSTNTALYVNHASDGGRAVVIQKGMPAPAYVIPPGGKQALYVQQNICDFSAVDIRHDCEMSMETALVVSNVGKGMVGSFSQLNPAAVGTALMAKNAGLAKAANFECTNPMKTMSVVEVTNMGKGNGVKVLNTHDASTYALFVENTAGSATAAAGGVAYFKQSAGMTAATQTVLITSATATAGHKTLVVTPASLTKTAAEFNGKVDVLGDLTAAKDVNLTLGNLSVDSGSLTVGDNASIGGALTVTEGLTVSGSGMSVTGVSTITGNLSVVGTMTATTCACPSDIRFKKNITPYQNALDKICHLQGVTYDWKQDEFPHRGFTTETQVGFIAQEVEKIIPELVHESADGYKAINYTAMTAILAEAIKEQQVMIEELKMEVSELKKQRDGQ